MNRSNSAYDGSIGSAMRVTELPNGDGFEATPTGNLSGIGPTKGRSISEATNLAKQKIQKAIVEGKINEH